MNVDTGELIRLKQEQHVSGGIELVPPLLRAAAEKHLAGRDVAVVSLSSGGKLSKWARKRRKEKRKASQQSRRQNRS